MSKPVVCVLENVSLAEAQLTMLKNNVSHLCVTTDGTNKTVVYGIISQQDLIAASNPVLIKEKSHMLQRFKTNARLTNLIQSCTKKNIPLPHINNIASEINYKRAVELAILDLSSCSFLTLGRKVKRSEQLLLTDQDSILILKTLSRKYREVKDYF
jgi:CBS domain-containing protein